MGTIQNAWRRRVARRLKIDYQYSAAIVYNNYPLLEKVSEEQRAAVEPAAKQVLDARAEYLSPVAADVSPRQIKKSAVLSPTQPPTKTATFADLCDPLAMPSALHKAHGERSCALAIPPYPSIEPPENTNSSKRSAAVQRCRRLKRCEPGSFCLGVIKGG